MPAPDPCLTCKWFRPYIANSELGACLVHPPIQNQISVHELRKHLESTSSYTDALRIDYTSYFHFPSVHEDDFCSLWEKITP